MNRIGLIFLLVGFPGAVRAGAGLLVYPPVLGLAASGHYTVRVRPLSGEWHGAFAWETACKAVGEMEDGCYVCSAFAPSQRRVGLHLLITMRHHHILLALLALTHPLFAESVSTVEALVAAAAEGKIGAVIELAEGTFKLTQPLDLKSGTTLKGAGIGKTIITHAQSWLLDPLEGRLGDGGGGPRRGKLLKAG
jgi:hypothetical protein